MQGEIKPATMLHRTPASSLWVHDVEFSAKPIGILEEQFNKYRSWPPTQVRLASQIGPTPCPNAAFRKTCVTARQVCLEMIAYSVQSYIYTGMSVVSYLRAALREYPS